MQEALFLPGEGVILPCFMHGKTAQGGERGMQLRTVVTVLPALLLLAIVVIWPCVSAADNATAGSGNYVSITVSITNSAREMSDLNGTTVQNFTPLHPVPVSRLKKITVPEHHASAEKQQEMFSDRDWATIRKSMTDLTEQEQDRLIIEMKKILNHTSSLGPDEQNAVSLKFGYYLINATEGGKPVKLPDRPGPAPERPVQTVAAIPLAIPFIAIGGWGIVRLLLLQEGKR
jgi:hypothetical protein